MQTFAIALLCAGVFAIVQGATGRFQPHDEAFLRMSASDLCTRNECRIVRFKIHVRVSFGGTLISIGLVYYWLASVPLRRGEPWSWWALVVSGTMGFISFFAYLGYGYLDTLHGLATLGLLKLFVAGLSIGRANLKSA